MNDLNDGDKPRDTKNSSSMINSKPSINFSDQDVNSSQNPQQSPNLQNVDLSTDEKNLKGSITSVD